MGEGHGRGAGQGQVVDLVRLPPGSGGLVEGGMIAGRPGVSEDVTDGAGVLGGEHHPPHLAAVAVVLKDLLADQLALAVAVGREADPLAVCSAWRIALSLEALLPPSASLVP